MEEDFREAGTRRAEGTALNEKKGGRLRRKLTWVVRTYLVNAVAGCNVCHSADPATWIPPE